MDGILGKTFSRIDYKVKYEIVYGFMPRPDYIDELNEIFTALKTKICYERIEGRIKKSECPAFFQKMNSNKQFIINGQKIEYRMTGINAHLSGSGDYAADFKRRGSTYGNGEETEHAVIFYKFVYLIIIDIRKKSFPEYKYSTQGFYDYEKNPDRIESETVYLLLRNCFALVSNVKTCKLCKQLYREEGRKPSKPITKITLKEMAWELVKDDPVKWIEKYTEDMTEKTTYTWNDKICLL